MDLSKYSPLISIHNDKRLQIYLADDVILPHALPWPPSIATLLIGMPSASLMEKIKTIYSQNIRLTWQNIKGDIQEGTLEQLPSDVGGVYLPAISHLASLESFTEIMGHLRDPQTGCPWDKEQTYTSLSKHIVEEAYEVVDALNASDPEQINEELGDLLMIITMLAQIGTEKGDLSIYSILQGITAKMLRRHPHIFAGAEVNGVEDVLQNWQKIKAEERKQQGKTEKGLLDGLPRSLPALSQALEMQARAAKVGFDWPTLDGVLDKIVEELEEIRNAPTEDEYAAEIGDLLFVLVNFARWHKIEPEMALQGTNQKFRSRFAYIEKQLKDRSLRFEDVDLAQMDTWWTEAKDQPNI